MLDAFGFDNYRVFNKETIINLKPLTIFTGPNSSGKSSVIKAAKLLKQNATIVRITDTDNIHRITVARLLNKDGGACQTPYKLAFLPDEYGHFLRSYESILNEDNLKNTDQNSLSLILPIKAGLLNENFFGKLTFGTVSKTDLSAKRIGFSLLIKEDDILNEVIHLQDCSGGFFSEIRVNFTLIKKIFEKGSLPMIRDLKRLISDPVKMAKIENSLHHINNTASGLLMLSERDWEEHIFSNRNSFDKIAEYEKWLLYADDKPILPFYQIFLFETDQQKQEFYLSDWFSTNYKLFEVAKEKHNDALGFDITQILNSKQKRSVLSYFKTLENRLFQFIKDKGLTFPFQQINEQDHSNGWRGIILDNTITVNDEDHQLITSQDTRNGLLEFEPLKELFLMYQTFYKSKNHLYKNFDGTNNDIINLFIRRLAAHAIVDFGTDINYFEFFDPNRIEQSLFYHSTNAPFAFKILSDAHERFHVEQGESDDFISSNLRLLNVADSFEIQKNELGIFTINLNNNGTKRPLAEFGYGITKIFFLLLAIELKFMLVIFIEEPETNLHPDLQSKLADILVEANSRFRMQFIIETHSEVFIRKLQYLVAKNEVNKDSIIINYFNPASLREKEGIIKEICIEKDGSLSQDFGPGFFDEALNWKFEILKLKNLN